MIKKVNIKIGATVTRLTVQIQSGYSQQMHWITPFWTFVKTMMLYPATRETKNLD
jgi:uncharacterized membrane protein YdfJ with MMPL/SSD domain